MSHFSPSDRVLDMGILQAHGITEEKFPHGIAYVTSNGKIGFKPGPNLATAIIGDMDMNGEVIFDGKVIGHVVSMSMSIDGMEGSFEVSAYDPMSRISIQWRERGNKAIDYGDNNLRIVVSGGRNFADAKLLNDILKRFPGIRELAHGGAKGADYLAQEWADEHDVPVTVFHADWAAYGKAAGAIRNIKMLDDFKPDLVISFPGDKGTAHMRVAAESKHITTLEIGSAGVKMDRSNPDIPEGLLEGMEEG